MSLHNVLNQHNCLTLVSYFNSDPLRALFKWKCICICSAASPSSITMAAFQHENNKSFLFQAYDTLTNSSQHKPLKLDLC